MSRLSGQWKGPESLDPEPVMIKDGRRSFRRGLNEAEGLKKKKHESSGKKVLDGRMSTHIQKNA